MKLRITTLLFISVLGILFGCKNDDDKTKQGETIHGVWNLKNVSGGLQGINIDYSIGEVIWNFNETSGKLMVENNITTTGPENIYAGLDSGLYDYQIQQVGESQVLLIDNVERGVVFILNNILKIDDGLSADGFITEFER